MDTADLTNALHEATTGLEPRPGFTRAVVAGGRRRQLRNRLTVATSVTAISALLGAGTYALWPDPAPGTEQQQAADARLSQPTRGDLAGDRAFLNNAAVAWREGLTRSRNASQGIFDDLRGQPHVFWAGTTAAGPAAVILQQAYLHPHDNLTPADSDRMTTLVGLVATDAADGKLKLVGDQYQSVKDQPPGAGQFLFGPGDRMLLVVDRGVPLYLSDAPVDQEDGRVTRTWRPLPVVDGVAISPLPNGVEPQHAKLLASDVQPAPIANDLTGLIFLEQASRYLASSSGAVEPPSNDERLPLWRGAETEVAKRVGGETKVVAHPLATFQDELTRYGAIDAVEGRGGVAQGQWTVTAGLADGGAAVVSERWHESQPATLYAVLVGADGVTHRVVRGPLVIHDSALPVRMRLPGGQGWVVADYGSAVMRYRVSAAGPWQDAGRDAAWLPDNAVQVQITKDRATPVVVDLAP